MSTGLLLMKPTTASGLSLVLSNLIGRYEAHAVTRPMGTSI